MTKGDIPSPANENLNEKQQQAIQLLLVGQTDQQVADAVGVTRQTVNQWKNQDPVFVARMNREKKRSCGNLTAKNSVLSLARPLMC